MSESMEQGDRERLAANTNEVVEHGDRERIATNTNEAEDDVEAHVAMRKRLAGNANEDAGEYDCPASQNRTSAVIRGISGLKGVSR